MSSRTGGRRQFLAQLSLAAAGAGWIARGRTSAEPPQTEQLSNRSPRQFQVLQRTGFDPRQGHEHAAGAAPLGEATVTVRGEVAAEYAERFEYRVELWDGAYGQPLDWQPFEVSRDANRFEGQIRIPAGGWYRLRIRGHSADGKTATDSQEPIGVGEVFLIAGQSYAAGANDELLRVTEPQNRVTAFDLARSTWQVAHDPQPAVGDGGTIWPPLGDLLVPLLRTPVAFAALTAVWTTAPPAT